MLNDVCSNISLIDSSRLKTLYPYAEPDDSVKLEVKGIEKMETKGYVKIPLWIEGSEDDGQQCLIKFDREFHIVDDFEHGILIGINMLTDYGINLHISQDKAILPGFSYEIKLIKTKFQSVLVRVKCDPTIQG